MAGKRAIGVVGRWWKGRQADLVRELRLSGHQVMVLESDEGDLVERCAPHLAGVVDLGRSVGSTGAAAERLELPCWRGLYDVPASSLARPPVAVMVAGRFQGRTLRDVRVALVERGLTVLLARRDLFGVCDAILAGARPGRIVAEAQASGAAVLDEAALEALLGGAEPMALLAQARGHGGAEQLALAELRGLLHEPPSHALWERVCAWLERCPEGVAPLAASYAEGHLARWDAVRDAHVGEDLRGCGLWGEVWDVAEGWDAPEAFGVAPLRGEAPTLWVDQVERGQCRAHHAVARRWTLALKPNAPAWPKASLEQARALTVVVERDVGFGALARVPWPRGLAHLTLRGARWGAVADDDAAAMRARDDLAPLRSLAVYDCGLDARVWRTLEATSVLDGLRRLELASGRFGRHALPRMVLPNLPQAMLADLRALSLHDTRVWPLDALIPRLSPRLRAFRLNTPIQATYAAELWRALGRFEALRWLELSRLYVASGANSALDHAIAEDAPWTRAVAKLNLSSNGACLTAPRLERLMHSALAEGLTHLGLLYNTLGPDAAACIASGAARASLEWLSLAHNPIGCRGAEAIAQAAWPRLRLLDLTGAKLTDQGAASLANAPGLDALEVIVLRGNRYSDDVLDAMRARGWRVVVSARPSRANAGRRTGGRRV